MSRPVVELRAKRRTIAFTFGFLGLLTGVTVVGTLFAEPRLFFIAFLLYCAWRWYLVLRTPYRIRLEAGELVLISFLGRQVLSPGQIRSIKRFAGGYVLEHDGKAVSLYGNMDGFGDLATQLEAANPGIELKGVGGKTG